MARRNKKLIAIIVIAIIIAIICCGLWFVGFDNIKAVYYGIKYDQSEIDALKRESSDRLNQKIKEYEYITAREPTDDEIKALESGQITEEQLSEIISSGMTLDEYNKNSYEKNVDSSLEDTDPDKVNPKSDKKQTVGDNPEVKKPKPDTDSSQAECDQKVSQIVAKMYILRSSFTSALSGLAGQAYADYQAGVPKSTVASNYISQGYGLEAQCDASVNALMSELTGILNQYGRSTELVNTIYAAYESEKQYTKAYYMSHYVNN